MLTQKKNLELAGLSFQEELRVANMLNFPRGKFPMNYLGFPISPDKISKNQFNYIPEKIEKKLSFWNCDTLSYGGRDVLINSCLSSIPIYSMGCYLLPEGIHQKLDSIRGRFYWSGIGDKRKFHMAKWRDMSFPKEFGGLGFTDTRYMNFALLSKWIFDILSVKESLCLNLLRKTYLSSHNFFSKNGVGASQFWKGLMQVKRWFWIGSSWKCATGENIRFWSDVWYGDVPFKVKYYKLFIIWSSKMF
uniref:Reverse transcriptase zinc-binding domain-containing protein n=1 Tax=Oryza brachyantha TaxID=4533 RepID=J3N7V7_ORYBR